MEKLSNPRITADLIKKHQFIFQKKFGQNFLIDAHIIDKIVDSAQVSKEDLVLEIGPGIGTMTQVLAEKAGNVIAVEIDKKLIPILSETLREYDNIEIINEDILKINLNEILEKDPKYKDKKIKVVANLPYYITTPIIMGLFENRAPVCSITIMIQKEVAERMQAVPRTKDYGALSLAVQFYSNPKIQFLVPPTCFIPKPNVGSAVVKLEVYDKPVINVKDEKLMFRIIRASFNQRRKTFQNGLNNSPEISLNKNQVVQVLEIMGLPQDIRGEALSLQEFAAFANHIIDLR